MHTTEAVRFRRNKTTRHQGEDCDTSTITHPVIEKKLFPITLGTIVNLWDRNHQLEVKIYSITLHNTACVVDKQGYFHIATLSDTWLTDDITMVLNYSSKSKKLNGYDPVAQKTMLWPKDIALLHYEH